jgi:phosphoglucosamine mutase
VNILKRLFGTDGIRGIVNEELTVDLAMKVGNSVARLYSGKYKTLLIAKDTRNSGNMFEKAISIGAISAGMKVETLGVVPTPTLSYLTNKKKAIGIMISASHNPSIYNGLKVIAEGYKIPDEEEVDLENLILSENMEYSPYGEIGIVKKTKSKNEYIDYLLSNYGEIKSELKIAIDVGHGAAGGILKDVLGGMSIKYDVFNNSPDGFNINEECGSTEPGFLSKTIKNNGYDLGILFDGDADRCLFIDKNGDLVDGDKLMAINSLKMKKQGRLTKDSVVSTIMSNLGFEEFLKTNDINLKRTSVGDKYVLRKMLEDDINIGGEQSGHIIFLDKSTTGDGFITALETLETLTYFGKNIDELIAEIPSFPQLLKNVSVKDKKTVMLDERIEKMKSKYVDRDDLRIVVRASGTEHKIRVMVEGKVFEEVEKVTDKFVELIESIDKEF